MSWLHWRFLDAPLEAVPEVVYAGCTNPMLAVFSCVARVQDVREAVIHELSPAELTMIVIPVRARARPLCPMERRTFKVPLLTLQPPDIVRDRHSLSKSPYC
jgi:hypothetical protein